MSAQPKDDLEAVRTIVEAVKDFKTDEQQRIFRWAAEKLGISPPGAAPQLASMNTPSTVSTLTTPSNTATSAAPSSGAVDIKTFMAVKKPRNDVQYAAAVAYYYRFEAPPAEKKDTINKDDLQEATRKSGRERFGNPLQTLNNAHLLGLLDRGPEKGTFVVNSVGENLIAMTLPDGAPTKKNSRPLKKRFARVPKKRSGTRPRTSQKG